MNETRKQNTAIRCYPAVKKQVLKDYATFQEFFDEAINKKYEVTVDKKVIVKKRR